MRGGSLQLSAFVVDNNGTFAESGFSLVVADGAQSVLLPFDSDISVYEPNYHTVNGLTFPDLASDPDSRVVCQVGDQVLIRFGNLGHVRQSVHFHGYHVEVLARNNVPETMFGMKDTIPLPGYSTAEVVMPVNQPGVFPLHPHSLMTVTDNGLYPGGQLLLIEAF